MAETLINGYELLAICAGRDPQEGISFTELENDLGEGMESSVLFGSSTGNRRFKLSFPVLSGASNDKTVTYNGQLFTPQDYLWDLFCRTKVTGTPFVVQSLRNDQYYLVKFVDKELSYTRMLTKLFTSGVELKQVRRPGVTVFDPSKLAPSGWFKSNTLGLSNGQDVANWANAGTGGYSVAAGVAATYSTPAQNGLGIVRFDGAADFLGSTASITVKQVFLAMKINAATFPNHAGILTGNSQTGSNAALVGASGTTKFTDFNFGQQYVYRKNAIHYTEANQQAPMNKFGIVHLRFKNGIALTNLQIGKDRNFAGRFAGMDVGEIVILEEHISDSDGRELTESLAVKWGV